MVEYTSALPTQEPSREYQSSLPARSQPRVQNFERSRYTLPVLLGITPEDVDQANAEGQMPRLQQAAQQQGTANQWTRMERRLDQSFEEGMTTEEAAVQLSQYYAQNPFIGSLVDPALVAQVMSSDNDLARSSMLDRLRKVSLLNDITQEIATQQGERSWPKTILDFVDSMVAVPVATNFAVEARVRTAAQITQLLSSNLSDEEFSSQVRSLITEVADQGWLTEVNNNYVLDMLDVLPEGGEGVDALEQRLWAVFDTATVVAPAFGAMLRPASRTGKATAQALAEVSSDPATLLARTGADAETIQPILTQAARVDNPTSGVNPVNREVGILTPGNRRASILTAPEHVALRNLEEVSPYLQQVLRTNAGQAIDDAALVRLRDYKIKLSEEAGLREVIDIDINADYFENVFMTVWVGTKKGLDFTRLSSANAVASRLGGNVVEVGENAYRVKLTSPLAIQPNGGLSLNDLRLFTTTNVDELGTGVFARFGSPLAQTDTRLNALLKQTEAGRHVLIDSLNKEITALKKKVGRRNVAAVGKVYDDLQSGRDAGRRTDYSVDEFKQRFFELNGRDATPQEVDYYNAQVNLSFVDWAVKADVRFKDAVNRGVSVLDIEGTNNLVTKVDNANPGAAVYNLDTKELTTVSRLNDKVNVYQMANDFFRLSGGDEVLYVATKKPRARRLYHSDVMPYNPGGPRINVGAKFFVKQEHSLSLADGTSISATPKTAMAVRLEDEANSAVRQLNTIVSWINSKLGPTKRTLDETYEALRGYAEDADFRRLLDENTEWNVHIQSMDDLIEFFKDEMLDPRREFSQAADGAPIGDLTKTYLPGINPGDTFRVSAPRRLGRRDKPLIQYGGDPVRTVGSIESLERSVLRSVAAKTEATYLSAAVSGLLKSIIRIEKAAAKNIGSHVLRDKKALQSLQGMTLKGKVHALTQLIDPSTAQGKKLLLEAQKIIWRMNTETPTQRAWNYIKSEFGDFAYKKGWSKAVNWADRYSTDPLTVAQGYMFDKIMGFFAWDQYLLQASQVINTMAISPVHGSRAAALYGPARYLLYNGKPEVMAQWGRWLQPITGLTPEQFTEALMMLKQDGRLITGLSVAELGEDIALTGGFQKVREAGRFFFNEGELVARITAHLTAYMEWTAKNVGPANSQNGRRWIALQQDKLTQAMTYASRGPFQSIPMTQFLSYQWRMTEAIFAGSLGGKAVLSKAERARLAVVHVALFGAAAVPTAGWVADRVYYKYGAEVNPEHWDVVRFGLLDQALSSVLGDAETAVSTRIGWGEGITQTIRSFLTSGLVEALGGPSGQGVVTDIQHLINFARSLSAGHWELAKADLNLLARGFKSYNMAHDIYTSWVLGNFYSRTGGGVVDDDVSEWETVAAAMGIPLQDIVETRTLDTMAYGDTQWERRQARRWDVLTTQAIRALESGDTEAFIQLTNSLATMKAAIASVNPGQAERIERFMDRDFNSQIDEATMRAAERMYRNVQGDQ